MSDNQPIQEHTEGTIARAKAVITNPTEEWPKIAAENDAPMTVFMRYAVPLAAIGPVAGLIGQQVFGYSFFGVTYRPSLMTSIGGAITSYVLSLLGLWLVAWVANFLSPKFDGKENYPAAFKLLAYSMTAAWLAGIFGLIPMLGILGLAGLYSLYLLYKGAQPMMGVPEAKAATYTVVTVLAAIVTYLVIGVVVASMTGVGSLASGGLAGAQSDSDQVTIDMGQYGKIETSEDGSVARFTDGNGEEVTVRVDNSDE